MSDKIRDSRDPAANEVEAWQHSGAASFFKAESLAADSGAAIPPLSPEQVSEAKGAFHAPLSRKEIEARLYAIQTAQGLIAALTDAWQEVAALRRALDAARKDTERLDWLESQSWLHLEKSDESDNNGVGLVDQAVAIWSLNPDEVIFPTRFAPTFRAAIDAASISPIEDQT